MHYTSNIYEYLKKHPIRLSETDIKYLNVLPFGFYLEKGEDGFWSGWGPLSTLLTHSEPTRELALRHTLCRLLFIVKNLNDE